MSRRPALVRCLKKLEHGDTRIAWRLDRLGRRLLDLITMLDDLRPRGLKFGRKAKLTPAQIDHARKLIHKGEAASMWLLSASAPTKAEN